ncbi:MAG: GNAT family N-acetyltransferase [Puniceicoccales bacterium]|jgi:RimJ/RimL family protein N-acetyltransferase|nr:GNAT family N-acetyltransferase [Puniceicoccales bacterium]
MSAANAIVNTSGLGCCPVLSSERLMLQTIQEKDLSAIVNLLSDYETVWMLTYAPWPYTVQEAVLWVNYVNNMCTMGRGCFWGIHGEGNVFIGTAGLSIIPEHEKAELHYWLGRAYWGQGYGTEIARRIMSYAFEDLKVNRLEVNHMVRNTRSQHVIEKCGFKFEGTLRSYVKRFDQFEDVKFYSRLREEFLT